MVPTNGGSVAFVTDGHYQKEGCWSPNQHDQWPFWVASKHDRRKWPTLYV